MVGNVVDFHIVKRLASQAPLALLELTLKVLEVPHTEVMPLPVCRVPYQLIIHDFDFFHLLASESCGVGRQFFWVGEGKKHLSFADVVGQITEGALLQQLTTGI